MNDHDEAHLYDFEDDVVAEEDADYSERYGQMILLLDGFRRDHDFMFAKKRDEEDWDNLKQSLLELL